MESVEKQDFTNLPDNRFGALKATEQFPINTIGYGVHQGIDLLYNGVKIPSYCIPMNYIPMVGPSISILQPDIVLGGLQNKYSAKIGTLFKSPEMQALMNKPASDISAQLEVATKEIEYWTKVKNDPNSSAEDKQGAQLALAYSVEKRAKIQEKFSDGEPLDGFLYILTNTPANVGLMLIRETISYCFAADTPILMSDGTYKPIEQIKIGDEVMAFDGLGELQPRKVIQTYITPEQEVVQLGNIKVTSGHQFLLPDGSFKSIRDLDTNDFLVGATGKLIPHPGIKPVQGKHTVYNFTVEELHTYVAGDYRVHNESAAFHPITNLAERASVLASNIASLYADKDFGSQLAAKSAASVYAGMLADMYEGVSVRTYAAVTRIPSTVTSTAISLASSIVGNTIEQSLNISNPLASQLVSSSASSAINVIANETIVTILNEIDPANVEQLSKELFGINPEQFDLYIDPEKDISALLAGSLEGAGIGAIESFVASTTFQKLVDWNFLSEEVHPKGMAIGGLIGAIAFSGIPVIGTVIGNIIGNTIGDLFNSWWGDEDYPRAGTMITYDPIKKAFVAGTPYVLDGGNLEVAKAMGPVAQDFLNYIVGTIGGEVVSVQPSTFGHYFGNFVYRLGQSNGGYGGVPFTTPEEAIKGGILELFKSIRIKDGNPYMMKIVGLLSSGTYNPTLDDFIQDLGIAKEYALYRKDPYLYGALILNLPDPKVRTDMIHQWLVTKTRAIDVLKLDEVANARTINFGNTGFANLENFKLTNASQISGGVRLTLDQTNKSGSVFYKDPIKFDQFTSFHTSFQAQITGVQGTNGADGFVFMLHNDPTLGTNTILLNQVPPKNSIAIEFDTFRNLNNGDINNNHVGLNIIGFDNQVNRSKSTVAVTAPFDLNDGSKFFVWIDYDSNTDILQVFLSKTATKPQTATLTTTIDVASILGQQAYVGLSASTNDYRNVHDILDWQFNSSKSAIGAQGNSAIDPLAFNEQFYRIMNPDVDAAIKAGTIKNAFDHYLNRGYNEGRKTNFDFNEQFYRLIYPDVDLGVKQGVFKSALEHYIYHGYTEGRKTNFDFNEQFYRLIYPDVDLGVKQGVFKSALEHYIYHGYTEGRKTNFDFDEQFYRLIYPDVDLGVKQGVFKSALEHYIYHGYTEGRKTNFDFNEQFYRLIHPDVDLGVKQGVFKSALEHYIYHGYTEGRKTNFDFNEQFYRLIHPDVDLGVKQGVFKSALEHYIYHGYTEGRKTNFDFNEQFYRLIHPDVDLGVKQGVFKSALEHYIYHGYTEGRKTNFDFNEQFYRLIHPDVDLGVKQGVFKSALEHYIYHGYTEGRKTNFDFNEQFYRLIYPDVDLGVKQGVFKSALEHYIYHGYTEGRKTNFDFNEQFYRLIYPDVDLGVKQGVFKSALEHYIYHGYTEGRKTNFDFNEQFYRLIYPDVDLGVKQGVFKSALEHYIYHGYTEGRVTNLNFDDSFYRLIHLDVDLGVKQGVFKSGLEHYIYHGYTEGRIAKFDALNTNASILGTPHSDILNGANGNNTLNGGVGANNMNGGTGNDTYVIDNAGDVVSEISTRATEIDNVQSAITYILNANVENLTVTGTANINGTGNTLNNSIVGNSGNNALNGAAGADTLTGGTGNDLYIVDNVGDKVSETSTMATEIDTVQNSVTFVLGANLENLTLTGISSINGTGNTLNNSITGNSGNNALNGAAGADTLTGGTGNDLYIVDLTFRTSICNTKNTSESVMASGEILRKPEYYYLA